MIKLREFISWQFYKLYKWSKPDVKNFNPSSKDIYLVSYPRSGNTWLRVILTELIYGTVVESLAEIEKYIPDVHFKPMDREIIESKFRVIKSHYPKNNRFISSNYEKIIYLIRDPRDVVLSYFRYSTGIGYNQTFERFFIDWLNGRIWPSSWQEHVNSWLGNYVHDSSSKFFVIKYEDLKTNTFENIKNLCNFIGLETNEKEIFSSISNSSIEKMKVKEEKGLRKGEDGSSMKFIGDGKSGNWESILSSDQITSLFSYASVPMKRFNYY